MKLWELTFCLVRNILPEPQAQLEVIETASHLPSWHSRGIVTAGQIVLWSSVRSPRHAKVVDLTCEPISSRDPWGSTHFLSRDTSHSRQVSSIGTSLANQWLV